MGVDPALLDNIDQFVKDEGRIVTYKWLSQQLSLDCRKAKEILRQYVEKERSSQDNHIHVIYFITGELKDNKGYKVILVTENKLEECKGSFASINSTEIYSVQNSVLKDIETLYLADYEAFKDSSNDILMCNSNIICEQVKFRKIDKKPSVVSTDRTTTVSPKKPSQTSLSNNKSSHKTGSDKKTLAGFWSDAAKANTENKSVKKEINDDNKPNVDSLPGVPKEKADEKVVKKGSKKLDDVITKTEHPASNSEIKSEIKERNKKHESKKSKGRDEKQQLKIKHPVASRQRSPQKSPQKSPLKQSQESPQKRKLIVEEADALQEEEEKKVNSDKDQEDVTEKVWESQSESDDEPESKTTERKETNTVKPLPAARQTTKKSNKSSKQSSLTSFFKKM
ncbi:uncharacterized protein TRIADDRAFT_52194 [Trichoplax adhaerens]|uniref:DNA polymerase delta subunit 3 n=1 Tax=Trichoplax adhaerens TaxID=10228 RepID=B3RM11_TRIAD|nr:hypothetical protein TRIADDRAFT_52194 [Trichoplax adhaerens]EDV29617.1 hypothetical protein TRIADDRAFT_52194 [Trichoplax adhaerens]|eukprot:XP_002108819.1 hypothetical protein TRIADDRAFT_52194 [Trichoplax adhaerens]